MTSPRYRHLQSEDYITDVRAELSGCAVSPKSIPDLDRYQACLLASALADAAGAPYEGGWLERGLWRLIGDTRDGLPRWTDDTQMALDAANGLLRDGAVSQDALARQFAASYHWSRGYDSGAAFMQEAATFLQRSTLCRFP